MMHDDLSDYEQMSKFVALNCVRVFTSVNISELNDVINDFNDCSSTSAFNQFYNKHDPSVRGVVYMLPPGPIKNRVCNMWRHVAQYHDKILNNN